MSCSRLGGDELLQISNAVIRAETWGLRREHLDGIQTFSETHGLSTKPSFSDQVSLTQSNTMLVKMILFSIQFYKPTRVIYLGGSCLDLQRWFMKISCWLVDLAHLRSWIQWMSQHNVRLEVLYVRILVKNKQKITKINQQNVKK